VKANATLIEISIVEQDGVRTLTIKDDGHGMDAEFLARVTDPFTTTRTTRPVGMGLPLLKLAAEQAGGGMTIDSRQGENHGTEVVATFRLDDIDCVPLGDVASSIVTLIHGSPDIDFEYLYKTEAGERTLSTREMREMLEGVPLNTPEVLKWVTEVLNEPLEQ
jgi:hypothetical protein